MGRLQMNERILELLEQAGFEENDGHISIQGVYMFNTYRMENLAELIVRECAKVSNQAEKQCQHPGTMIKQHFGVE
jgi:hypothetical protein